MTTPRYVPARNTGQQPWQRSTGFHIPTQRSASPVPPSPTPPSEPDAPTPPHRPQVAIGLKVALGAAVGLLAGLVIGSSGAGQAAPAPQQAAISAIPEGGGRFQVGTDLEPGTYQTSGPDDTSSTGCYYARLKSGDGSLDDILDNYVSQGPMTVVIPRTDGFFQTTGCDAWTKVH
ncbi:hypothetical protein [Pseudonocardia spinosispora]|uniref:hypothetical protein n=1 Tax=Pseudonocardia spinosispora TaxID=103441 RepID=UPI000424F3BF|nr:hypothetical protein [Pseudonocardia spinosispora]